jgi:hypothetical protein
LKQLNSSKKIKSSDTNLNKADDHFNRGLEFILSGGKKKNSSKFQIKFFGGRKMEATDLVFSSLITIMFFLVGIIGGWNLREYLLNYQDTPRLHPEFFDEHGNVVPDEVVSVRFEEGLFDHSEDEDE